LDSVSMRTRNGPQWLKKPRSDHWKTGRDQTQHLNIYTDGFKVEGGVGAGLYSTDLEIRLSYKLPSDCSIFQAEVFAIRKAAEVAQNINQQRNMVNLFVDSQYDPCSRQRSVPKM